jgi:hypothetical protein
MRQAAAVARRGVLARLEKVGAKTRQGAILCVW